jgi:limonene-1,2-epoxide hydrolase
MTDPLTPERLVEVFATAWALPKPEPFIEHFVPHLHPDVVMYQPGMPPMRGIDGFARSFRKLFALVPDLVATVDFWAASGATVLIVSTAAGTLGRRPVSFAVCDRFDLTDGMVAERRAFFDPTPLRRMIARQPQVWRAAVTLSRA